MATNEQAGTVKHTLNKAVDTAGGMVGQADAQTTDKADEFVESAAISDMYEIESSRVALDRSQNPTIREAAQKMIDDHTESSSKLETSVQQSPKVEAGDVPGELDSRRSKMVDHLGEAPADRFDETFIKQQVMAHEEAVKLMKNYRDEGDCQVLRSFATEVTPVIEDHLDHMKRLETNMAA
jgi:putative membrane protein